MTYLDLKRAVGDPARDKGARVVRGTAEGDEHGAVLRVGDLGDEKRRGAEDDGIAEPEDDTRGDEHAKAPGAGLQAHGGQHDDAADDQAHPAAPPSR